VVLFIKGSEVFWIYIQSWV